jgi:hypothetical protein
MPLDVCNKRRGPPSSLDLWSVNVHSVGGPPHAVANSVRNLSPAQALVNEPRAHYKLLSVEHASAVPVDQVPYFSKFIVGKP